MARLPASVAFALSCAISFSAATARAQWQPSQALNAPPPAIGFTLTPWDNGELLLFGGSSLVPGTSEWAWNGVSWRPVTTPVPRRFWHALGRDDAEQSLLLFGGMAVTGGVLTDTWTYQSGVWTQLTPSISPPAMNGMSMAYDPIQGCQVLIGSTSAGNFETWRFVGDWQQVNTFASAATWVSLVTDSVRRELLLMSHDAAGLSVSRLVNGGWVAIGGDPVQLTTAHSAFDVARGRAVVVGSTAVGWIAREWDGLGFVAVPDTAAPQTNALNFDVAYHAARQEFVLVDGTQAPVMQTLHWTGMPTAQALAFGAPCQDPAFELGLGAGTSPQLGASHVLRSQGQSGAFVTLSLLGFSFTQAGLVPLPQPIPVGSLGCLLRVDPLVLNVLGFGQPASQLVSVPNSTTLLGVRYQAQFLQFDNTGVRDSSNGLDVQIGLPLPVDTLVETFASASHRDATASGDVWANGEVSPTTIGGDGRHGSFDAMLGLALGGGVYEWSTDNQLIPGAKTVSGSDELVTDGRFAFTDLVVPAGVTVRFVGTVPVQLQVRGRVEVLGTIDISGVDLPYTTTPFGPAAGERLSNFNARVSGVSTPLPGQPGGAGGPGGASGGRGANKCLSAGPIVVGGVIETDGQPGGDVRLPAGHAYAGSAVGTGGRGSPMHPASGLLDNTVAINSLYRGSFSRGGAGGGFSMAGSGATAVLVAASIGPAGAAGAAFPLLPLPSLPPPNYSSLQHFLVGGSGGGGGGSHNFGTFTFTGDQYLAGHGGSGGGGALAIRAGGDLSVAATANLRSRGGLGVVINGDNVANNVATGPVFGYDITHGISSPGGGGSGGSFLLQSARDVMVQGAIDTAGGAGSRAGFYVLNPVSLNIQAQAGAGSPGFYRLEAGGSAAFTGSGVPAFVPANNVGALTDSDDRTGSRSQWLIPATTALPVYLRYELLADINGVTVLFSDDANVSPLRADDASGPVQVRFQGALIDAVSGSVVPATIGPWRDSLRPGATDSVNRDRAKALRFDLVLNKSFGVVRVRELRVLYR